MSTSADTKKETKEEKKAAHPPFDGKDFEVWFERMKLKLERKGVWKYCEKEIEEPEESKQDEHDAWKKDSARAKELLYDGMTDKIMKTVKFEPTAFRVVERLKQRFVGKTYFKYAAEMTQLRKLRLQENGNMPDHLGEVRRLIDRIALLGKPLDEYEKPAILIGTLPDAYDNVVETFLASHVPRDVNDPPNYDQLEHALELAYDRRQGRKLDEGSEDKALFGGSGRGRGRGRGRGSDRGRGGRS
ncbi:hypothetical protein PF008_g24115 [Phytophthora fragariae]|uniref:Uncharacterized protein n=1 Tax=Phytophthora fragariae TaxID=53985 RepID=A0A6G0QNR7_9STRA|nr:hypothetical protein PF003_g27034 [Phytophthora fragariae]KAE9296041.1 hypothetical protein PF008_g24115 [Phytophthora fragariae]